MEDTIEKPATRPVLYQLWFTIYLNLPGNGAIQEVNMLAVVDDEDDHDLQDPTKAIISLTQKFTNKERDAIFAYAVNVLPLRGNPNPAVRHEWITEAHNLIFEVTVTDGEIEETNLILIPADLVKNKKRNYFTRLFYHYEVTYSGMSPLAFVFWKRQAFFIAGDSYRKRQAAQPDPNASARVYEVNIFGQRTALYEYRPDIDGFDFIEKEYIYNIKSSAILVSNGMVRGSRLRTFEFYTDWVLSEAHRKLHLLLVAYVAPVAWSFYLLVGIDMWVRGPSEYYKSVMDGRAMETASKGHVHRIKHFLLAATIFWAVVVFLIKTHKQVG